MTIPNRIQEYLEHVGVDYEVLPHPHTTNSSETAEQAHVPGDRLAKGVVLEDQDGGYLLAVLPASRRIDLGALHHQLRRRVGLATEREIAELFSDCEVGAVPPLGHAYGIDMIFDDSLAGQSDLFFESGDHADLIHVSRAGFDRLMAGARHGNFSHHR